MDQIQTLHSYIYIRDYFYLEAILEFEGTKQCASISLSFLSIHRPICLYATYVLRHQPWIYLWIPSVCLLYAAIIRHLLLRVLLLHHRPADVFTGQRHQDHFCPIELPKPLNYLLL